MPGKIDPLVVELTADFPVKDIDVDSIWEVDTVDRFNDGDEVDGPEHRRPHAIRRSG